jgi:hypothetical protein
MHIYAIEIILVVCMFGRAWIWNDFPVRLAEILYKNVFIPDGLLSYMSKHITHGYSIAGGSDSEGVSA